MKKNDGSIMGWLIFIILIICAVAYFQHQGVIHLPSKIDLPPVHVGGVREYISQTFGIYAFQALNIAECESSMNPAAYNPTPVPDGEHAQGLFQIIPSTFARVSTGNPYSYIDNTDAAYKIFSEDGDSWREWECQP